MAGRESFVETKSQIWRSLLGQDSPGDSTAGPKLMRLKVAALVTGMVRDHASPIRIVGMMLAEGDDE